MQSYGHAGQWACGERASLCITHKNILLLLQPTHKHSYWIPAGTQDICVNNWDREKISPKIFGGGLKTGFFYTLIF